VAGEFAKRSLTLADARQDLALKHDLGSPRHLQPRRLRRDNGIGLLRQSAGHLVFRLVVEDRHGADSADQRIVANTDRNGQVLTTLLSLAEVDRDIMCWNRLNADAGLAFDLKTIKPNVLGVCTENLVRVDAVMESPKLAE
jgi:hypothetical protein